MPHEDSIGREQSVSTDKITIIIYCHNQARHLGAFIRNLETTTLQKSKVNLFVVLSQHCTDNSVEMAKASSGAVPLQIVRMGKSMLAAKSQCVHCLQSSHGLGAAVDAVLREYTRSLGDICLLLPTADILLPPGYDEMIRREFGSRDRLLLTSFRVRIQCEQVLDRSGKVVSSDATAARLIESFANLKAGWLELPICNSNIAFPARLLTSSGGFPTGHQAMSDCAFVANIRKQAYSGLGLITLMDQSATISTEKLKIRGAATFSLMENLSQLMLLCTYFPPSSVHFFVHEVVGGIVKRVTL
jgi:hypothetical protein